MTTKWIRSFVLCCLVGELLAACNLSQKAMTQTAEPPDAILVTGAPAQAAVQATETPTEPGGSAGPLEGSAWTLVLLNGHDLVPGTTITASFENGGTVGSAGCNHYSSRVEVTDGTIEFGMGIITEVLCLSPEGVMEQETRYREILNLVSMFTLSDGQLEMRNERGDAKLLFQEGLPDSDPG